MRQEVTVKDWLLKERTVFLLMLAVFFLLLIPIFVIANYNVPCVDDYSYGNLTHRVWENTGSFWEVLKTAVEQAKITYYDWQGTFTAIFMMALQPAIFGESFYFIVPYLMLVSLIGGTAFLSYAIFRKIFGATWSQFGIVFLVLAGVSIQMLPSASQGFYWYNGSVFYTFFYGVSLILYGLVLLYIFSAPHRKAGKETGYLIGISLLAFFIGGSNYVTSLITVILFVFAIASLLIVKNPRWKWLLIPFAILSLSFAVNVVAPGNAVRQSYFHEPSAVKAIFSAMKFAVSAAQGWMSLPFVCLLVFLVPLLWKMAVKSEFHFRFPLLMVFLSAGTFVAMYCPPAYAMDGTGDKRLVNIIFYAFVFLVIWNLFYFLGWLAGKLKKFGKENHVEGKISLLQGRQGVPVWFVVIITVSLALSCLLVSDKITFTSTSALYSLTSGQAQQYYEVAQRRLDLLHDDSKKDVVLEPYPSKPYVLYFDDIGEKADDSRNRHLAKYYNKNTVTLGK